MAAASGGKWDDLNREILAKLDLRAEYEAVGIRLKSRSTASGWTEVVGNSSAAVNLGDDSARGRYRDLGGDGANWSFWDAMIHLGGQADFKSCRKHFAEKSGVKIGRAGKGKSAGDLIKFQPWNDGLAAAWARHKEGCTTDSARRCGAELGSYPAKGKQPNPVIALPVFGPQLLDAEPTGWVALHRGGRTLPVFQGRGSPAKQVKILSIKGTKAGWVGKHGLLRLEKAERVYKTEGVPDLIALQALIPEDLRDKHVVLTNSAGCGEIPQDVLIEHLAGKEVVVIHDADKPGQGIPAENQDKHRVFAAKLWCQEIAKYAASVKNVQLPYAIDDKHGKDLRDWICEGRTYADLLKLVDKTEVFKPKKPAPADAPAPVDVPAGDAPAGGSPADENPAEGETPGDPGGGNDADVVLHFEKQICAALQIDVMGEVENGKIKMFSIWHRKMEVIRDVSRWTLEKILQFCGPPAKAVINRSDEFVPGQYSVQQIREAVALIAGSTRLGKDAREVGRGVWRGRMADGEASDTIVLVGPREAARVNGESAAKRVLVPRVDGLLLDIGENEKSWYDFDKLNKHLKMAQDTKWCENTTRELDELFRRWTWKQRKGADASMSALVCTGLVLATWVQTLWKWRPLVAIIGGTNTGKTTLCEMLGGNDHGSQGLFGGLSLLSSQSSEAGIRQAIRNTAAVLMCDEFEDSKDRTKILNLFRTSGRGAKILRGTAAQKSEAFGLQHIPWVAAIGVGLKREPDRNRFIMLELDKPPDNEHGKLRVPAEEELIDLGLRLLAIAVTHARQASIVANSLKSTLVDKIDKRVVENYSVPAAMIAVSTKMDATDTLLKMLNLVEPNDQGRSDERELLKEIITARVDCGRGERWAVGQILTNDLRNLEHFEAMENQGVGTIEKRSGQKVLFIAHRTVVRELLRGTDWSDVDQILSRLPGAKREKQRLGGSAQNGISVPYGWVQEHELDTKDGNVKEPEEEFMV